MPFSLLTIPLASKKLYLIIFPVCSVLSSILVGMSLAGCSVLSSLILVGMSFTGCSVSFLTGSFEKNSFILFPILFRV